MPPEESPALKYERLQKRFQAEILNNYPNPERKGCPGEAALRILAAKPMDQTIETDPNWHHITHCSECYREFLDLQVAASKRRDLRKELLRWGVAGSAIVGALVLLLFSRGFFYAGSKRPQNAELAYAPRRIVLESTSRSVRGGGENEPYVLERGREALTVELPVGSKAGLYEFQLRDSNDRLMVTRQETALIVDGVTSFLVRLDLTRLAPGRYKLEVRQPPWDWVYCPVVLR